MKVSSKRELQQTASNNFWDIYFKDFMKIYKKYTKKPYFFLADDRGWPWDSSLPFKKNILNK